MLPNFLIIGAMKSGTTSLFHYIGDHPQVFVPKAKEVRFFTNGRREDNWRRGLSWYESQFVGAEGAVAVGEASPAYTKYPEYQAVPARIASVLPGVKLIYMLRHPIERMRSHYLHHRLRGWEHDPIDKALLNKTTYLYTSLYALQIQRYLEHFPREQILVLMTDELRASGVKTLEEVYGWIGVDPSWQPLSAQQRFNRTEDRAELPRGAIGALQRTWNPWNDTRSRLSSIGTALHVAHSAYMRLTPRWARQLTHRGISPAVIEVSDSVRSHLEDRLRPDVEKLRDYVGGHFDGWGIA